MTSCGDDDNSKSDQPDRRNHQQVGLCGVFKEYLSRFKNLIYVQFNDNVSANQKRPCPASESPTRRPFTKTIYFIDSDMLCRIGSIITNDRRRKIHVVRLWSTEALRFRWAFLLLCQRISRSQTFWANSALPIHPAETKGIITFMQPLSPDSMPSKLPIRFITSAPSPMPSPILRPTLNLM